MKKRQKHKESILQRKDGRCYLCMKAGDSSAKYTECHHVFGGSMRKVSEAEGLKAYLCPEHHRTGKESVHLNAQVSRILKAETQAKWEENHTRAEWMTLMHRNYREE